MYDAAAAAKAANMSVRPSVGRKRLQVNVMWTTLPRSLRSLALTRTRSIHPRHFSLFKRRLGVGVPLTSGLNSVAHVADLHFTVHPPSVGTHVPIVIFQQKGGDEQHDGLLLCSVELTINEENEVIY